MGAAPIQSKDPLSHLRVLDLTQFLSGPYATQILGDLGADVIKIEPPIGDMTRDLPPYFVGSESAYFLSTNRNKRSVAIDLKMPEGQKLVSKLASTCDVVVENFRPGVADRLGLQYEKISTENPSLVWCSISGFGQSGPYRDRPAYDMIVQAISGGMSLTGQPDGVPVRSGIPLGDLAAGMYGVIGILAAIEDSRRTGRGRLVDIAMLDCQVAMLSYQAAYYLASGKVPERQGRAHDSIPTYRCFRSANDIDVVVTANTEKMWRSLCEVLELSEFTDDPRFANNELRYTNKNELWKILDRAFLARGADTWVALLQAAGIPAAVVNTLDRSLNDPQVIHREMVLSMQADSGEIARVAGNPIKFHGMGNARVNYPPKLNADADYVVRDMLGISEEEYDRLKLAGVIGDRRASLPNAPLAQARHNDGQTARPLTIPISAASG